MAAKPPLGTGERFRQLTQQLAKRKGVTNPAALAAWIGRRKYGKRRFQELAARGRRRAAQNRSASGGRKAKRSAKRGPTR